MNRLRAASSAALGLAFATAIACSDTPDVDHRGGDRDAGGADHDATPGARDPDRIVSLAAIGSTALGQLTPPEVEALCEEDARRIDLCTWVARNQLRVPPNKPVPADAKEVCEATRDQCRAVPESERAPLDCSSTTLEGVGACPVTVDEYLACADAYSEAMTCDNAGRRVPAPEACRSVTEKCPGLGAFASEGASSPCPVISPEDEAPDTNDDVYGIDGCRPVPARFVVLGDSIAACSATEVTPSECGPVVIANALREKYAPDLAFESHAAPGKRIRDLPSQAAEVQGGEGHVFVWIHAVGNDLLEGDLVGPEWERDWQAVFDYFGDTTRFPDGATFLLNGQYSPWDECVPEPIEAALPGINQRLFIDVAEARSDTVAVDHLPDSFGHGQYANDSACPHCGADNTRWVAIDGIHPNAAGYAHMAEKWAVAFERMLPPDCANR